MVSVPAEEIPWSQLPILVLSDGRKMGQSSAISDYLANKFDLCGLDDWDAARCKEISGSMRDLRQGNKNGHFLQQEIIWTRFTNCHLRTFHYRMEKVLFSKES
jgi:glutathione S-transferase